MQKYFEVLVDIKTETEFKGAVKIKMVKEIYLVDAMSVTEAEARVVKQFVKSGFSQDFVVVGVKGSKIIDVIEAEEEKARPNNNVTNLKNPEKTDSEAIDALYSEKD
jgi:Domain of unknown function (DUF4494)